MKNFISIVVMGAFLATGSMAEAGRKVATRKASAVHPKRSSGKKGYSPYGDPYGVQAANRRQEAFLNYVNRTHGHMDTGRVLQMFFGR
jgi:hypothetical protein